MPAAAPSHQHTVALVASCREFPGARLHFPVDDAAPRKARQRTVRDIFHPYHCGSKCHGTEQWRNRPEVIVNTPRQFNARPTLRTRVLVTKPQASGEVPRESSRLANLAHAASQLLPVNPATHVRQSTNEVTPTGSSVLVPKHRTPDRNGYSS